MAFRAQNSPHTTNRVPSYYAHNKLYKDAFARTEYPTRTSRRLHDGLSIDRNYGLDTKSDDVNASPYSSPYYVNGRFNSNNLKTQTGNSSSVQGVTRLLTLKDEVADFSESDVQTTIELWQGKQIKFMVPYNGKVVGTTLSVKNTNGCRGILSIYLSAEENGPVLAEMAVDLCSISEDHFEHKKLYTMTPVPASANARGKLYVRMEIWNEIDCERSDNPFNTGRKIELLATGHDNHTEWVYTLGEKNVPVDETPTYEPQLNRPLLGLIYNNWHSIPVTRNQGVDYGARVSKDGFDYDIYCITDGNATELVIYNPISNTTIPNNIHVDGRSTNVEIVQATDYVYLVDGYSTLQRIHIGDWAVYQFPASTAESVSVNLNLETWVNSGIAKESGLFKFVYNGTAWEYKGEVVNLVTYGITVIGTPSLGSYITVSYIVATSSTEASAKATYVDVRPVIAPEHILMHNNRIYLYGFRYDHNLVQYSEIDANGPNFNNYPYRFYSPGESPLANTTNPITAMVEFESDRVMITTEHGYALYQTNANAENTIPAQVSTYSDGAGAASSGDICSYRGIIYSFDPDEGIRRFTGSTWNAIPSAVDTHVARVDMGKPRKLWGYAYKLFFNYTDSVDGKAKCLIWDMQMNYQQYPWFQDIDLPFCDVRYDNDYKLYGIHPDFPCIMKLYDEDVWRRLDTPINFETHTKYLSLPGNASDMTVKRVHNKVLANADRWWYLALTADKDTLYQERGDDVWYRMPCWATHNVEQPVEAPFPTQDIYETQATALFHLNNIKMRGSSVQEKIKCKTFRAQANLVSVLFEAQVKPYL